MTQPALETALAIATAVPLIRCAWCVVGLLRLFANHARAQRSEWGWLQLAITPEAYVLTAAAVVLRSGAELPTLAEAAIALPFALLGAALSLAGLALSVWTFAAFPAIGTGHYVANDQTVISKGPYAWVRHPTYVGVLLMWFGLGLAHRNFLVLLLAVGVSVLYALYARSEERMMHAAFGDYAAYSGRVGGFVPKSLRPFRAREATRPR